MIEAILYQQEQYPQVDLMAVFDEVIGSIKRQDPFLVMHAYSKSERDTNIDEVIDSFLGDLDSRSEADEP